MSVGAESVWGQNGQSLLPPGAMSVDTISHQTQLNTILLVPCERGSSQTHQDAAKGTHLLPGLPRGMLTWRRQLLQVEPNKEKRYFNPQQLLGLALTGFKKAKSCQNTMEKKSPWKSLGGSLVSCTLLFL